MNGIEKSKEDIIQDVLTITGLLPHRVKNIYIFGSRVYGTYTINSDYDIIVLANSMFLNHEIYEHNYNVHVTTPDSFEDQLRQHDIHCLECIFGPSSAQVKIEIDYLPKLQMKTGQLKKMIISQSSWAWTKAQKRIEKGNIIGGAKSLFHSLRILNFGHQIMRFGKIIDFSLANEIWKELRDSEDLEWNQYQQKWMPKRRGMIKEMKNASLGQGALSSGYFGDCNKEDL
jgi:predicted nucleotidyltransferase